VVLGNLFEFIRNENRAMEESMSEMEKELVATKMKWAEVRYLLQYFSWFSEICSSSSVSAFQAEY
jgi:hypothetical protein